MFRSRISFNCDAIWERRRGSPFGRAGQGPEMDPQEGELIGQEDRGWVQVCDGWGAWVSEGEGEGEGGEDFGIAQTGRRADLLVSSPGVPGGEEGLLARPLGFNESILGTFLNLTTTVDPAHWEDSFECAKIVDIFSIPCFTPQSIAFSFTALILGKSYIGINFVKKGTHE